MNAPEKNGGMVARPYQLRLLDHAIKQNSIIYLPTGSGKTYIAIMLIRHFSKDFMKPLGEGGKRCVFLCNTVELSRQVVREIATSTNFKVGLFIGDMNVDNWPQEKWETEINSNQVFVGTSQVFVDMVSHRYLSITDLSCVIMDECHHATKAHPMHVFLSLFMYADQKNLPRVVGLTGVLLKSSKGNILKPLEDLEAVFRGKIITVQNLDEFHNVLLYSTSPEERMITYSDTPAVFDVETQVKGIISNCCNVIENWSLGDMKFSKNLQGLREPNKLKQVKSLLSDFEYQMDDMGLYAASIAIMGAIVHFEVNKRNSETMILRDMYRYVITQCEHIRHILVKKIGSLLIDDEDDDMDEADIILNFSKPKLQALLMFFLREFASKNPTDISCLLFVKRRYTARCLYFIIQNFAKANKSISHLVPEFMVGRNSGMIYTLDHLLDSKWNRMAVDRFRRKECNLIVCSSVLEEGIDVQACNYVISFDRIQQFSSYVQMKGRARAAGSSYLVICELRQKLEVADQVMMYKKVDSLLKNYLITRTIDREIPEEGRTLEQFREVIAPFITPSGAILQAESTLMLLHRYCQTLPHDSFTQSTPIWSIIRNDVNEVQVSLQLPSQSTVKTIITSDIMRTCKLAKISAAFKACVQLFHNGELNENLLPLTRKDMIENVTDVYFAKWNNRSTENTAEDGSKKKIRTYNKVYPDELISALPTPGEVAFGYCISIEPEFREDEYNVRIAQMLKSNSNFAIILKHKIPTLAPMPLFMTQGALSAQINSTPFEFIIQSEEELMKLKKFNKMLFSDIRELWKDFLAIDNRNGPNSFLIAPVKFNCSIDWTLVYNFQSLSPIRETTVAEREKMIFKPEDYLGIIVDTWYTSREDTRYVVTKIRYDLNPFSDFVTNLYKDFATYVKLKYDVTVVNKQQFMIEAQKLTNRTNFFVNAAGKSSESKRKKVEKNIDILIPETCHNFRFPGDLWLKSLLLPSILHRFHYLLYAEKLRVDINRFLGITTPADYQPAPIQIDYSLGRVRSENEPKEPPSMLPALDTTRQDKSGNPNHALVDIEQGNWKAFLEPIDIQRHATSVYPIEIDYYYQFVNNLLEDMEKLNLEEVPEQQTTVCQLEAHKPKVENFSSAVTSKKLTDASFDSSRRIKLLDCNDGVHTKSAEQFEFLAAITSAAANDVFDMERFEVLGDSFLKFSVSLLLMHRHPNWNEGFLTAIKSRIVSNRNLFYCFSAKFPGSLICSSKFEPKDEWLPPSACVPANVLSAIECNGMSPNCLLELSLSTEEINSGMCNENTLVGLYDKHVTNNSTECFNEFLYKQTVRDKVLADCVEALLGVCVKNYGVQKSFEMLDYFGIYYDTEKNILSKLLQINLGSPLVRANINQSEVDAYLTNYEFMEANLQYKFKDRAYLLQAVTHPSYPTNQLTGCYQQLEFIGDAILDFLISSYIFENCTHMNPGEITDLRSALVNNVTLACVCVRNRFQQYMLYESPPLSDSIKKFVEFQNTQDHRVTDQVKILLEETANAGSFNMAQNIDVPKALGDVMEAIIGAVFLDSGNDLQRTWAVISHLMEIELNEFMAEVPIDPVRQLYEYRGANPSFQLYCTETDVVMMQCMFYCRDLMKTVIGCGGNKFMAKKAAAKMALQILHAN